MSAFVLSLPRLRPNQWDIAVHPAKFKVVAMGRRWGKTILGLCLAMACAAAGGRVAWIVPTYKNGRVMWRAVERALTGAQAIGICRILRSERMVEFSNGGFLGIYSAENIDGILGEAFDLVILDEAARIAEEAWTNAIQPTLADRDGSAILISTPKGRNWFYQEWIRGLPGDHQEPGYMSWTAPSSDNPIKAIHRAMEKAKRTVPSLTYQQEWLAQFVADSGTVFRDVSQVSRADRLAGPLPGHHYVFGIDWGRHLDFTVVSIFDAQERRQVGLVRFNEIGWGVQRARIEVLALKWQPDVMVIETNSIGEVNLEELRKELVTIRDFITNPPKIIGFDTNQTSKNQVIDALALALEMQNAGLPGGVELLNDAVQIAEFQAYEQERASNGLFKYSAPSGMHDDTVMAAAFALAGMAYANRPAPFELIDLEREYARLKEADNRERQERLAYAAGQTSAGALNAFAALGPDQKAALDAILASASPDNHQQDLSSPAAAPHASSSDSAAHQGAAAQALEPRETAAQEEDLDLDPEPILFEWADSPFGSDTQNLGTFLRNAGRGWN